MAKIVDLHMVSLHANLTPPRMAREGVGVGVYKEERICLFEHNRSFCMYVRRCTTTPAVLFSACKQLLWRLLVAWLCGAVQCTLGMPPINTKVTKTRAGRPNYIHSL